MLTSYPPYPCRATVLVPMYARMCARVLVLCLRPLGMCVRQFGPLSGRSYEERVIGAYMRGQLERGAKAKGKTDDQLKVRVRIDRPPSSTEFLQLTGRSKHRCATRVEGAGTSLMTAPRVSRIAGGRACGVL